MKRLFTAILLISTVFCIFPLRKDYVDITYMTYISSIGLEYDDEEKDIKIYCFLLNNFSLGKSDYNTSTDVPPATTLKANGKSVRSAFFNMISCFNITVDFSHIDSIVINTSFYKLNLLNELIDYVKDNHSIYPDFKVYLTEDAINEIYDIEHFNDISSYYSIFTENKSEIDYPSTNFTIMTTSLTENMYFCLIPSIKAINNIADNSEAKGKAIYYDGYFYFKDNELKKITFEDYPLLYLIYSINDVNIRLDKKDYAITHYYIKTFHINKKMYLYYFIRTDLDYSIKTKLTDFIKNCYKKGIDFYNFDYYEIPINSLKVIGVEKRKSGAISQ